jgi:hypothetical protein
MEGHVPKKLLVGAPCNQALVAVGGGGVLEA